MWALIAECAYGGLALSSHSTCGIIDYCAPYAMIRREFTYPKNVLRPTCNFVTIILVLQKSFTIFYLWSMDPDVSEAA